jgi:autotransporter passenger strand-loop-strand repeat protein
MSRKKKLKKKIAVAVSVVNLLNISAPLVLPYVNVAGQVPAAGGQIVQFADTAQSVLYRTAQAAEYNVPDGATTSVSVSEMSGGDTMNVKNGGTGTVATMSGGVQDVYDGGTGTVTAMSDGWQYVRSGGTGTVTAMSDGWQDVSSGGTGTVTTMSGGVQYIHNGGTGTVNTMSGGWQYVRSGGMGTVTAMSDGTQGVFGTGTVTTMNGGVQDVSRGGTGTVSAMHGGTQNVLNGGTSMDTTIKSGGKQTAETGGILAGTQTIEAGGVASGGTLTGKQEVAGMATDITVSGTQNISSGGVASGTIINSKGYQYVSSGGVASGTIINSKGYQYVNSGGTAVSTTISNGTQNVNSGGTAASTTISNGTQNVFDGGTVVSTTISGGNQGVNSGGVASGTTISSGVQYVYSGGTTNELTIHSGGIQVCQAGATINGVTLDGGTLNMADGVKASGTLQGQGRVDGISVLSVGGTDHFSSVVVSGGSIYTSKGFVIDSGGSMKVDNTGATSNTTVKSGGMMSVLGGGTANGATLSGGTLDMAREAKASGTLGGHGTVVYDGGSGQFSLGGANNFSSFTVSGGTLETQNGFQICSSGGITVNSGGTLIAGGDVMVQTSGTLTVSSGGSFSAANISAVNGGEISISGGTLQAAGYIAIDQALTNAYGSVSAGGSLTLTAGATQPGSGKPLSLSAVRDINISGDVTVTDLSAGEKINAGGKAVSATNISAGGAIEAGSISATNVAAGGNITAGSNISADSISAGGVSAGGNVTAETLALSAVPASGAAVSAGGDVNVTNLNVSGFDPEPNTVGSLVSAGGTVSEMTVNGKALTAGKTIYMNETATQLASGIDASYATLSFSLAADQKTLTYDAHNTYKDIAFSTVPWNTGSAYYEAAASDRFNDNTSISAEKLRFTFAEESQKASLASGSTMTLFANATGLPSGMAVNYGSGKTSVAQSIEYKAPNGAALTGTLTGTAATTAEAGVGAVKYTAGSMTLDSVDLAGWDGTASSTVPDGWTAKNGTAVTVYTDNMKHLPTDIPAGGSKAILTAAAGSFFLDNSISGGNKYGTNPDRLFTETDTLQNAVVIKGTQDKGVKAADTGKSLVYAVGIKDVTAVSLGAVTWQKDAVLLDGSDKAYNYSAVASLDDGGFGVAFEDGVPETVAAGDSMTLLKANETLHDMAAVEKQKQYKVTMQSGDLAMYTVDAILTGNLTAGSSRVAFTAAVNQATKLTFENVNWLDSGALIDHKTTLANVSFNGADVDTSKINFINKQGLKANQQMTLVSDFGDRPGTITGTRYKVGTAFEGEGAAEMSGNDLIFKTKTGAGHVSDETHHAVMAVEAGMALLAAGGEHVGSVMNGIGLTDNTGSDGTSVAVSLGGGAFHYETGSHVNSHTWNAVVAAGAKKELEKGTLQYGLFGEYGKGNYTLHSKAGRGDGDAHYAGGGLLAKWTNNHSVYAEASIRQGRMSDTATDILHDGAGNGYGYNVHTNYFGVHLGLGKVFYYNSGRSLDVYGKYFYTKRNGVNFETGTDHYDLDSVASSILRIGARYGSTDKKWNWYGGLAYEYEFDGEANGTVNGTVIRSASVKGSSIRSELGLRMDATKDNPWKADISVYGYGGKHRGFGGSVNVAYTF